MMFSKTISTFATVFFATTIVSGAPVSSIVANTQLYKGTKHRWGAPGAKAAIIAESYLGTPYHWGGTTPKGFDCSGLVQFAYNKAGIELPRTVQSQQAAAAPVRINELRQGDLVFFRRGEQFHVGIYVTQGRFIHAPSRGKRVTYGNLNTPYWQNHYKGAGRVLAN